MQNKNFIAANIMGIGSIVATAGTATADLGQQGSVAIQGDIDLDLVKTTLTAPSGREDSQTTVGLQAFGYYFVADHVSVGAGLGISRRTEQDDDTTTSATVTAAVGYQLRLGERVHVWPQLTLGYGRGWGTVGDADAGIAKVGLGVMLPFLYEPAPHFFLAAGPVFARDLTSSIEVDGDSMDGSKVTVVGFAALIGGYFGD